MSATNDDKDHWHVIVSLRDKTEIIMELTDISYLIRWQTNSIAKSMPSAGQRPRLCGPIYQNVECQLRGIGSAPIAQ